MENKLFMVMLGCRPKGRVTEQHDIFFGIGKSMRELIPKMNAFWPEAGGKLHIDAWREVTSVDGHRVSVVPKSEVSGSPLYFVNLGGYKPGEFEEYHYKILSVGEMADAVHKAKQTAFYKHCSFPGAASHVDDKFGIDLDDIYPLTDLFDPAGTFGLKLTPGDDLPTDVLHIGYLSLTKL